MSPRVAFWTNPENQETAAKDLQAVLLILQAMRLSYHISHWQAGGEDGYEKHLLFERFYTGGINDEIDTLGEKIVGYFGAKAVAPSIIYPRVDQLLSLWESEECPYKRGLTSERSLQTVISDVYTRLKNTGGMSLGVDDFLMATANAHETNQYLLQQYCPDSGAVLAVHPGHTMRGIRSVLEAASPAMVDWGRKDPFDPMNGTHPENDGAMKRTVQHIFGPSSRDKNTPLPKFVDKNNSDPDPDSGIHSKIKSLNTALDAISVAGLTMTVVGTFALTALGLALKLRKSLKSVTEPVGGHAPREFMKTMGIVNQRIQTNQKVSQDDINELGRAYKKLSPSDRESINKHVYQAAIEHKVLSIDDLNKIHYHKDPSALGTIFHKVKALFQSAKKDHASGSDHGDSPAAKHSARSGPLSDTEASRLGDKYGMTPEFVQKEAQQVINIGKHKGPNKEFNETLLHNLKYISNMGKESKPKRQSDGGGSEWKPPKGYEPIGGKSKGFKKKMSDGSVDYKYPPEAVHAMARYLRTASVGYPGAPAWYTPEMHAQAPTPQGSQSSNREGSAHNIRQIMAKKWIQKATSQHKGALRKHYGVKKGESIPVAKMQSDQKRLRAKKDKTADETHLLRQINLALSLRKK